MGLKNTRTKQNNYSKRNKNSEINFPKSRHRVKGLAMHSEENNKRYKVTNKAIPIH